MHQQTQRTAAHVGWLDRGVLAPGYVGDVNVIDLAGLECRIPHLVHDLPAGGRRLMQEASGYRYTVKSGAVTFEDGDPYRRTARPAAPGRTLTLPQALPTLVDTSVRSTTAAAYWEVETMRKTLITLGIVATIAVAGCSSSGSSKAKETSKPTAKSASASTSTTQPFVANTKNTPGTLKGFVGAKADVHDTECTQAGARWNAAGRVTNPTTGPVTYRIYVSFLSGDTTVGIAEVNIAKVGAKQTEDFEQGVKVAGKDLRCILRVERTDA